MRGHRATSSLGGDNLRFLHSARSNVATQAYTMLITQGSLLVTVFTDLCTLKHCYLTRSLEQHALRCRQPCKFYLEPERTIKTEVDILLALLENISDKLCMHGSGVQMVHMQTSTFVVALLGELVLLGCRLIWLIFDDIFPISSLSFQYFSITPADFSLSLGYHLQSLDKEPYSELLLLGLCMIEAIGGSLMVASRIISCR